MHLSGGDELNAFGQTTSMALFGLCQKFGQLTKKKWALSAIDFVIVAQERQNKIKRQTRGSGRSRTIFANNFDSLSPSLRSITVLCTIDSAWFHLHDSLKLCAAVAEYIYVPASGCRSVEDAFGIALRTAPVSAHNIYIDKSLCPVCVRVLVCLDSFASTRLLILFLFKIGPEPILFFGMQTINLITRATYT